MSLEKYTYNDLSIEPFIDSKQNIYFKGKEIASALGYEDTPKAIERHVSDKNKTSYSGFAKGWVKRPPSESIQPQAIMINESGLYQLIMRSKLPSAEAFQDWVTSEVLPSIRKYGFYKRFDTPNKLIFKIEDEYDLHTKVVQYIRRFYPNALIIAGLGELQNSWRKRIQSWKKGYQKGQPDIIISNLHKYYNGFCIEFKTPKNNGVLSDAQKEVLKNYKNNGYKTMVSSDYDMVIKELNEYMCNVRIKCIYCNRKFISKKTLSNHQKGFHKIKINI